MPVSFEGTYTKSEFIGMAKLARNPIAKTQEGKQYSPGSFFVGIGVILAFISWVWGSGLLSTGQFQGASFVLGILSTLSLLMLGLEGYTTLLIPNLSWKNLSTHPFSFKGTVTNEAVETLYMTTSQSTTSQYQWEAFAGYGEHEDTIVLFLQGGSHVGMSRWFFQNDNEWEAFREQVAEKLTVTHRVTPPTAGSNIRRIVMAIAIIIIMAAITFFFEQR
jgi:hypothetical protein